MSTAAQPTGVQVRVTESVVAWYLETYWMTAEDMGTPTTFLDRDLVGDFSLTSEDFEAGEPAALARLLIAVTLFQRLRDQLVLGILRQISAADVTQLASLPALAEAATTSRCPAHGSVDGLRLKCNLFKNAEGRGGCGRRSPGACQLHRHTEILKRYGHFGKVPTSLALALREAGATTLTELYENTLTQYRTRSDRAEALERSLCRAWRVDSKIASMFLSLACTPGLSRWRPPWRSGVAWERFVVIDSNVDLYLRSIGYRGSAAYESRRRFVTDLASEIDLRRHTRRLARFNPRLVQQAIYMFAGRSNRVANEQDCSSGQPATCRACPQDLSVRCPVAARAARA